MAEMIRDVSDRWIAPYEVRELIRRLQRRANQYHVDYGDHLLFMEAAQALQVFVGDSPEPE